MYVKHLSCVALLHYPSYSSFPGARLVRESVAAAYLTAGLQTVQIPYQLIRLSKCHADLNLSLMHICLPFKYKRMKPCYKSPRQTIKKGVTNKMSSKQVGNMENGCDSKPDHHLCRILVSICLRK